VALVDFVFSDEITHDPVSLAGKKMTLAESMDALERAIKALASLPDFEETTLETALRGLAGELGVKVGPLLGIIRMAVTGKKVSPPLFGTLQVLGRERVLARMRQALQTGRTALAA